MLCLFPTLAAAQISPDPLTPEERAWLTEHDGKIRFAPDPSYAPVCFLAEDGTYQGLTMDYVRLLEERLGFAFKMTPVGEWGEIMARAQRHEIDVIGDIHPTRERESFYQFTEPYITIPNLILTRKDGPKNLSLGMMQDMTVVVVEGYDSQNYLAQFHPLIKLIPVTDTATGLQMVSLGNAEAMVTDLAVASYNIDQLGLSNLQVAGRVPQVTWSVTFGSRNDWPVLNSILSKGLATITEEEARTIKNRWMSLSQPQSLWKNWRLYTVVGLIALIGWGMAVLWTQSLRRQVADRTEALRLSEERYSLAVEAARDGIWDWNIATGEVYYSPRYASMLGYGSTEVPGHVDSWVELIHPDDRDATTEAILDCTENRKPDFSVEFRMQAKDQSWRWILGRGKAVARDVLGQAIRVVGTHTDINQIKQDEEEKLELERQVQRVQKLESLGVLAGGIAHDFNNLLMAIMGNAELAKEELPVDSPACESLREIEIATHRAADLAGQMLAYSGKGKFVVEEVHLDQMIKKISHLLEVSIPKKIQLNYVMEENLPTFSGDITQVRQVVMNLVTNAAEAIGDQQGNITLTTGVHDYSDAELVGRNVADQGQSLPSGPYLFVEVADDGCGIPPATISRIFDPFFTTKFTGRGLGMSVVQGIVSGHHGALFVDSAEGIGSRFRVLFPVGSSAPVRPKSLSDSQSSTPEWQGEGTLLLADDDLAVLEVGQRLMEGLGFTVLVAKDGNEASSIFQANSSSINISVLDLTMPGKNGNEVYEEIRRHDPDAKIILSSGYNEQEVSGVLAKDPNAIFMKKPYSQNELKEKLQKIL